MRGKEGMKVQEEKNINKTFLTIRMTKCKYRKNICLFYHNNSNLLYQIFT